MTHSPAPWKYDFSGSGNNYVVDANFKDVNGTEIFYIEGTVSDADATLIAAAPDLLDALKDLLFHLPEVNDDGTLSGAYDAIQSAKAAISKAEPNEIT